MFGCWFLHLCGGFRNETRIPASFSHNIISSSSSPLRVCGASDSSLQLSNNKHETQLFSSLYERFIHSIEVRLVDYQEHRHLLIVDCFGRTLLKAQFFFHLRIGDTDRELSISKSVLQQILNSTWFSSDSSSGCHFLRSNCNTGTSGIWYN